MTQSPSFFLEIGKLWSLKTMISTDNLYKVQLKINSKIIIKNYKELRMKAYVKKLNTQIFNDLW